MHFHNNDFEFLKRDFVFNNKTLVQRDNTVVFTEFYLILYISCVIVGVLLTPKVNIKRILY